MSLRTRLLLLVAFAVLVPAIVFGIRFYESRAAEIELALVTLATQANNIASGLDEKIQGTAQLHFGLARAVDLDRENRAECSAFLSAVRGEYPQFTGILTISPEGRLFCDSLQTDRELDLSDREYFQKALLTKDAVTMQPAFGRLTGISVLQIAFPARSASGQLKFVLLASFNLQKFVEYQSRRLPAGVEILLLDKKGMVLVSTRTADGSKRTGASIADTDLFRFAESRDPAPTQTVKGIDGRPQFWASASTPAIRDSGLYIMVGTSRDRLVADANKRLYEEVFTLVVISLLLFGGVWGLAEVGIRSQVARIAAMADKLGAGDLSVRIDSPYPSGELGGLMIELNATAESLQRQHAAIDDLNQKLYQSQATEARTKIFLDAVIEHTPLPIVVKVPLNSVASGHDWRITLINKAYEDLTGFYRANLIGKSARDLFSKEAADLIDASDRDTLTSSAAVILGEFPLVRADKRTRTVMSKKVAIRDPAGEAQYLLTVLDDVTEKRQSERRIAHMAHFDSLTDLPNRAAFNEYFAATLLSAAKNHEEFALLSIDLDRFKEANDVYGHVAGDALLQEVARRLQIAAGDAFIARIGGDEFSLIVAGGKQPESAEAIAQRLIAAFFDDFVIEGKPIRIGLGIGGAIYPKDGIDAKTLMTHSDAALYRAKAEPGPSMLFFETAMGLELQERHSLQHDLRLALDRGELLLHYQPQFKLNGEAIGFEALARWQSPTRGAVPPSTFIPVAEEYSLIIPLGEWALREACREAASWPRPLTVAVNVSPIQFHHGDLPRLVHSILLETGLAPSRLTLEITEGVLINDFSRAVSILVQLKALGVKIALDDFGKGYSSLSYLHSFAFDKIKIDRAFVSDLEHNRHSIAIVRAVIGLGHSLKIPILAEGVETGHQRAFLMREGCDELQGYFTGRPFPIGNYNSLVGRETLNRPGILEMAS